MARKTPKAPIEFTPTDCAEQLVTYDGLKFYWIEGQGNFRRHGESKPYVSLTTKRDVVMHIYSKYPPR